MNMSYVVSHNRANSLSFQCIVPKSVNINDVIVWVCEMWFNVKGDGLRLTFYTCHSWEIELNVVFK
jgi:hypothetical protein